MKQVSYTKNNIPTKGVAKKIWDTLIANGFVVDELHYNYGRRSTGGSGTWACEASNEEKNIDSEFGFHCGVVGKISVYLQQMSAPFGRYFVGFSSRKCPFLKTRGPSHRIGCDFFHLTMKFPHNQGYCDGNCDSLTDDQLFGLSERFEEVKNNGW